MPIIETKIFTGKTTRNDFKSYDFSNQWPDNGSLEE